MLPGRCGKHHRPVGPNFGPREEFIYSLHRVIRGNVDSRELNMQKRLWVPLLAALFVKPLAADLILLSTENRITVDTHPSSTGQFETEAEGDFFLPSESSINSAPFVGLPSGATTTGQIGNAAVGIYRFSPNDSTRVNSPADVEFDDRDSGSAKLLFTTSVSTSGLMVGNPVQPGDIDPKPRQIAGGAGQIVDTHVKFNINFTTPSDLPAGRYFFVPQVLVAAPDGNFYWPSAPKPIVSPGAPVHPGITDSQVWTIDPFLDPDSLRAGAEIVDGSPAPSSDMTFSPSGTAVPEPSSYILLGTLLLAAGVISRTKRRPEEANR